MRPAKQARAVQSSTSPLRGNAILDALPGDVRIAWAPHLELVKLESHDLLYESGFAASFVWFPIDCVVAIMQTLEDGASAQVALVGKEGLVGAPLFLGASLSRTSAIVQCAGLAARIRPEFVLHEFERGGAVTQLLLRHMLAVIGQMAQIAACNRHHTPEQQFCRWLLMTLDRADCTGLQVTQEVVATMLGVRRETVSEVESKLRRRGALVARRGGIDVADRQLLERAACECYGAIAREYARLFPPKS